MKRPATQPEVRSAEIDLPLTMTVPLTRIEDGTLRVTGTRIPIDNIVHAYNQGETAEQFRESFPTVSVADFHAVVAYYLQHRELIDRYLHRRQQEADELRQTIEREHPWDDLREKLIKHREALGSKAESAR
jgi:uncharacterized protein (DUF433 family)